MNSLYYGDNLGVLRESINPESVDLIYLDPPFNSNASSNVRPRRNHHISGANAALRRGAARGTAMTQLTSLGPHERLSAEGERPPATEPNCSERRPRRTSSASVRRLSLLVAALLVALGTGCSVVELAEDHPGVDVSSLTPSVPRAEVESRLGAPVRSWTSTEGVRYSLYRFDNGVPLNAKHVTRATLSVATLGLSDFYAWLGGQQTGLPNRQLGRVWDRVVVSYDENDTVLGLFDEFETLPTDGHSDRRPKVFER